MSEETSEQLFGKYLAAKKAVLGYGLSENFPDEQAFETAPTSSATRIPNLTWVPDEVHLAAGSGKSYVFIRRLTGKSETIFKSFPVVLLTPEASNSEITVAHDRLAHSDSMATQQSSSADGQTVEQIISEMRSALNLKYRESAVSRLTELHNLVQEEESDSSGISCESLQRFFEFLRSYSSLRCPAISLTPERNIYASWKSGPDRVFSIHFLPQGEARFVIFFPNHKHQGQTIRLSGRATVDTIMSVAEPHGILNWVRE
jgi:hypothetical protein